MNSWIQLIPKVIGYKFFRAFNVPKIMPFMMTVSVTNQCNGRCKTCNIWKLYKDKIQLKERELNLREFEVIFEKIGNSIIWFNISGGEPFLRPDLVKICKVIYEICNPKVFTIPTNGLLPQTISRKTEAILNTCENASIIVNLSIDGIENKHDEIRGVRENYKRAKDTFKALKTLRQEHKNLKLGVHTVVSKFNINRLPSIYDSIKAQFDPDSYICEPAENRSELMNLQEDIAPDISSYDKWVKRLIILHKRDYSSKAGMPRLIQAVRLKYYGLAVEELRQKRQVIPCYAGFASCHISPYGDVWPCCILAYRASMGNLRDHDYSFREVWRSERAEMVRQRIKAGNCNCPMANIHYTNMLCNIQMMFRVAYSFLFLSVS